MDRILGAVTRFVTSRPLVTIAGVVLATVVLGGFATQMVSEDGVAVDNELSEALDVLDAEFGESQAVTQVVVESDRDLRSVDGLRAAGSIREAITTSDAADTLVTGGQQPPIASYLEPAEAAVDAAGIDVAELDDAAVRDLQEEGRERLPDEVAGLVDGLLADDARTGLVLVFQDVEGLDEAATTARQEELADVIAAADLPDGVTATAFSFGLLLSSGDIGPEVGRLFGTALAIILVVLAAVYWTPGNDGRRGVLVRRTAADVGLTLAVIVLAVVWMQGAGVLLGPDYAGLIGYFSPQTQIVPILIVGLGVDFAIHLLARYRSELGGRAHPTAAAGTTGRTVGLTLALCTAATAIGFLTNLASPVEFLATLGVLAAVGIAAAFVLALTLLLAARTLLDRRGAAADRLPTGALARTRQSALPRTIARTAWLAERRPGATLVAAVALVGLGGYGYTQLDSEFSLTDFVPSDEPLLETFEVLESAFNGGFEESTQVLVRGPLDDPAVHNAVLEAVEVSAEIEDVDTVAGRTDATSIASVLRGVDDELADALTGFGVSADGRIADDGDVDAAYRLLIEESDTADAVLAPTGDGWSTRVEVRTSAGQAGAWRLAEDLKTAFDPVSEAGAEVVVTSEEILQAGIGQDIEDSQLRSLLIALGAAMALLTIHFTFSARRPLLGVVTVAPVGLVLALTFGTMALTGVPLNPVTATLAALSIGIGVPFTIHVTSRFLEERGRAEGRELALRRTLRDTGGALVGSALTTAIGFGVLVTSTLAPFEQLGYVIVYAIVFSVVAAVLVLPSLLALWDRYDTGGRGPAPDVEPARNQGFSPTRQQPILRGRGASR